MRHGRGGELNVLGLGFCQANLMEGDGDEEDEGSYTQRIKSVNKNKSL